MYAKRAHAGETFLDKGQGLWSTSGEMLEPEGSTTTGGMQTGFWTGWYHGQDRSSSEDRQVETEKVSTPARG